MQRRARFGSLGREWPRGLLVVVLAVGSLRSAVADWNNVPTGSMKPAILGSDRWPRRGRWPCR